MGPDDHSRFSQMESGLAREFSELVIDQAKENRWNLMGIPAITFEEDESIGKGEFQVEARSQPRRTRSRSATGLDARAAPAKIPSITGAISLDAARGWASRRANPQLVVLDDDGRPAESISITRDPVVIGRLSTNDVVLSDPERQPAACRAPARR